MPVMTKWGTHLVRHDSSVPLYRQIELTLSRLIASGELAPQTILPSEAKIAEMYGVSRLTVRQAVSELRQKGMVNSRQGKGTFVSSQGVEGISCLTSFTETALRAGMKPESQVISFGEVLDPEMAAHLDLSESSPMVQVVRLRLLDGVPAYLSFAHFPVELVANLRQSDFVTAGLEQSLYQTLERSCGLQVNNGEETVSATLAAKQVSQFLGVGFRSPVVERTCTMRMSDGQAIVAERTLWAHSQKSPVRFVWSAMK